MCVCSAIDKIEVRREENFLFFLFPLVLCPDGMKRVSSWTNSFILRIDQIFLSLQWHFFISIEKSIVSLVFKSTDIYCFVSSQSISVVSSVFRFSLSSLKQKKRNERVAQVGRCTHEDCQSSSSINTLIPFETIHFIERWDRQTNTTRHWLHFFFFVVVVVCACVGRQFLENRNY